MSYEDWGFRSNPFETTSLSPTKDGSDLLVGREEEVRKLQKRLTNSSKFTTVEGLNGVGKTSLVNVAVYRKFLEGLNGNGGLLVPCNRVFQLSADINVERFREKVLYAVAQTLFGAEDHLPIPSGETRDSRLRELKAWISSPFIRSFSAGLSGVVAGLSKNTGSSGFSENGVFIEIENILERLARENVFVVCTLDNLELLETSEAARKTLEQFRDPILNIVGLRWVLCGALGIMYGVASSARLSGYMQKPLQIDDLERKFASETYRKRVEAYSISATSVLPLSEENFARLFQVFRGNLREVLSSADEFCTYASDIQDDGGDAVFDEWLEREIRIVTDSVASGLKGAARKVFLKACNKEVFSPSDYADFGYDNQMALRPQIKTLEDLGLLKSSKDEKDKRRKNIQVLPKGWLVFAGIDDGS